MPEAGRTPEGKARLKEIIDEHIHRTGLAPADLEVDVADRSTDSGVRTLRGDEITGAKGGFLEIVEGGRIPFHRVRRVRSRGRTVFERDAAPTHRSPRRARPVRRR